MRVRFRIIAKALGVLVVALIVAAAAILYTTDLGAVRGTVERQVERALDRPITVGGDIGFSLSLNPTVSLAEVTLANVPGGSRPEMATVGLLEGQVELLPLLRGEVRIIRLVAHEVDLLLERDGDGRPNWLFGRDGGIAAPTLETDGERSFPHLGELAIESGRLTYLEADGGRWEVGIDSARLSAGTLAGPTAVHLEGTLQGIPLAADGTVGALRAFAGNPADWPVDLSLRLADSRINLAGTVLVPDVLYGYSLGVEAEIAGTAAFARLAGADLPDLGPLSVSAALRERDGLISLDRIDLRAGDSDLSGEMVLDLGGAVVDGAAARPTVTGTLAADRIDLADFGLTADPDGADAGAADGSGRLIPDIALALDDLDALDAGIDIAIGRLVGQGEALEQLTGRLGLNAGTLTVTVDRARLWQGDLVGTFVARGGAALPMLDTDLRLTGFDLGRLLTERGATDQLDGQADLTVSMAGEGVGMRQVAANAAGRVDLTVEQGRVRNETLALLGRSALTALLPQAEQRDTTRLNCAVARFVVTGGVARSTALLIDTPLVTIGGEGAVDLRDEMMDVVLTPRTKDATLLAVAAPVRLHGPLSDPTVTVDTGDLLARGGAALLLGAINPATMVVPFVTTGTGDDNPCLAALSGAAAAPADSSTGVTLEDVQRSLDQMGRGAGETLDQIGRDAEGLLEGVDQGIRSLFGN